MNLLGLDRIFNFLSTQSHNFKQPGLPRKIQEAIDWKKSAVAGSYALHQFTGETHWNPNDVDIMVACQDKEDFLASSTKFENSLDITLIRYAWFDPADNQTWENGRDERFHESVLGTRTYQVTGFDKPIQLICLQKTESRQSPAEILGQTTDIPACVSYTMCDGQKIFHIPERGREILLTKKGSKADICPSRYEKYLQRGYKFY